MSCFTKSLKDPYQSNLVSFAQENLLILDLFGSKIYLLFLLYSVLSKHS